MEELNVYMWLLLDDKEDAGLVVIAGWSRLKETGLANIYIDPGTNLKDEWRVRISKDWMFNWLGIARKKNYIGLDNLH